MQYVTSFFKAIYHVFMWAALILLIVPPVHVYHWAFEGLLIINYFGVFLTVTLLGLFARSKYCFIVWLQLDRLGAGILYWKQHRTISGILGENAAAGRLHYVMLAKFVDFGAYLAGDGKDHCYRAWISEQTKLNLK